MTKWNYKQLRPLDVLPISLDITIEFMFTRSIVISLYRHPIVEALHVVLRVGLPVARACGAAVQDASTYCTSSETPCHCRCDYFNTVSIDRKRGAWWFGSILVFMIFLP